MALAQALAPLQAFAENFGQMLNQIAPHNLLASLMSGGQPRPTYQRWPRLNTLPVRWRFIQRTGTVTRPDGIKDPLGETQPGRVWEYIVSDPDGYLYWYSTVYNSPRPTDNFSQAAYLGLMGENWTGSWGTGTRIHVGRTRERPEPPPFRPRPPGKGLFIGGDIESAFF